MQASNQCYKTVFSDECKFTVEEFRPDKIFQQFIARKILVSLECSWNSELFQGISFCCKHKPLHIFTKYDHWTNLFNHWYCDTSANQFIWINKPKYPSINQTLLTIKETLRKSTLWKVPIKGLPQNYKVVQWWVWQRGCGDGYKFITSSIKAFSSLANTNGIFAD